jgi:hypothetical protein
MKFNINKLILWIGLAVTFMIALMCSGCCPDISKEPSVRIDTLTVYKEGQHDTLAIVRTDTVWSAENNRYIVRIDTVFKRITVYRKPDTLRIPYPDTVIVYRETKSTSFLDGITLKQILIGGSIIVVIGLAFALVSFVRKTLNL